jgi:hypothetical protein
MDNLPVPFGERTNDERWGSQKPCRRSGRSLQLSETSINFDSQTIKAALLGEVSAASAAPLLSQEGQQHLFNLYRQHESLPRFTAGAR